MEFVCPKWAILFQVRYIFSPATQQLQAVAVANVQTYWFANMHTEIQQLYCGRLISFTNLRVFLISALILYCARRYNSTHPLFQRKCKRIVGMAINVEEFKKNYGHSLAIFGQILYKSENFVFRAKCRILTNFCGEQLVLLSFQFGTNLRISFFVVWIKIIITCSCSHVVYAFWAWNKYVKPLCAME